VLTGNRVRVTLFNVGRNVAAKPGVVAAETDAGMWISDHSYTHPHLAGTSRSAAPSELQQTGRRSPRPVPRRRRSPVRPMGSTTPTSTPSPPASA
jgi:peptidoglycan/xylan/chitin deacetylase (PgdA/CDA1 family)